jgi:GNAT superfamily N-acetyltransferase
MTNAFENPDQFVIQCFQDETLIAFFVCEMREKKHAFWSLVGLVPDAQGRGMGKSVWPAALNWLRVQGVDKVSTSISSLNAPVVNLYVRLGFRFPEPEATYHWHYREGSHE